ncbi:hypothetical protein ACP4OV_009967 [Aristida adscensionis]
MNTVLHPGGELQLAVLVVPGQLPSAPLPPPPPPPVVVPGTAGTWLGLAFRGAQVFFSVYTIGVMASSPDFSTVAAFMTGDRSRDELCCIVRICWICWHDYDASY